MSSLNNKQYTLLLNKMWQPLRIVNACKAIHFFVEDQTVALDPESFEQYNFDTWIKIHNDGTKKYEFGAADNICSSRYYVPIPAILLLKNCTSISTSQKRSKNGGARFSKRKVFERDDHKCGYCLSTVSGEDKTIDHFIPQSLGGATTYGNTVTCCKECNAKKADTPFEQLKKQGWQLHHKLTEPAHDMLYYVPKKYRQECWDKFLGK
jgi:hypothetical protein